MSKNQDSKTQLARVQYTQSVIISKEKSNVRRNKSVKQRGGIYSI